jgi:hypothetical protein
MGVSERIDSINSAAVGAVLFWISGAPYTVAFASLPNGTFISATGPDFLTLGQTYSFSFIHVHGYWWNFMFAGPTTGSITGGPKWANGTYMLGTAVATSGVNPSSGGFPMQFLDQFGNASFTLPRISVPNAIGIERSGSGSTSYRPTSGNALDINSSAPIGIEGKVQNSSLPTDSVNEAGNVIFPGTAAPLWGRAPAPLGVFTPQAAAYTLEGAISGNEGVEATITIPAEAPANGRAMLIGVEEPVNSTIQLGAGVAIFDGGIEPYCFNSNTSGGFFYLSSGHSLPVGSNVLVQVIYGHDGWWDFNANGTPIVNTSYAYENGTAYLGHSSAAGLLGTLHDVSATQLGEATFPMLGIFGNGTIGIVNATHTLLINEPGRGWISPDYAQGWHWAPNMLVEANQQDPSIPIGETVFGTNATAIPHPISAQGDLLWTGELDVNAYASVPTIVSDENTTVYANVTTALSIPSGVTICGSVGAGCQLQFHRYSFGVNWSAYWANYTGPVLTVTKIVTINITVNASAPPDYSLGSETITLTLTPVSMVLQSRATPVVIAAGNSTTIYIWVNSSLGPVLGAAMHGAVSPVSGQEYLLSIGPSTVVPGLYNATFAPPATLTTRAFYNITFYANASGVWGNSSNAVEVEVDPLPMLSASVTVTPTIASSDIFAGERLALSTVVMSGHQVQKGAQVTVNGTPAWWITTTTGTTAGNGVYSLNLTAPANITTKEGFIVTVTASAAWHLSFSTDVVLSVIPAIITGIDTSYESSTVDTGGLLMVSALASCLPAPCPSSLTYSWAVNNTLGSISPATGPAANFTAGGSPGYVDVTVKAVLLGSSFSVSIPLTIVKQPATPGPSIFSTTTMWLAIACVVVVVAVVVLVLMLRRRKSAPPKAEAVPPKPASTAPTPPKTTEPAKPAWSED